MEKRVILLIGYKGLIGNYLYRFFKKKKYTKLLAIDKDDKINLLDSTVLKNFLEVNKNINYIINASGKNDHIKREKDKNKHEDVKILLDYINENVVVPKNIIELSSVTCKKLKSVVHFSSLYGLKSPYHPIYNRKKSLSYCVSKTALEGLTKYYATLLAPKGIRINNIRVGGVKNNQPKDFIKSFLKKTPINQMVNKKDLANTVDFLCSEKSKYIIGENISLDGGYTLW
ncbi:SDR family oxidoreductase [Pelagibacterales bacterium SAG-MED20]|nr:SDR family oxidoreductase [Pelagibacterales bacterium SAG-MED20]